MGRIYTITQRVFSQEFDLVHPEFEKMEYAPSNRVLVNKEADIAQKISLLT